MSHASASNCRPVTRTRLCSGMSHAASCRQAHKPRGCVPRRAADTADQPRTRCITSCLTPISPDGTSARAATIVSYDAFDGNAEAPEVGDGGDQERDGAFLLLVGEDLSTRYPGMVVDSDVDEFPACTLTAAIACAASGDAVAHAAETAELLNIEMDDLAWLLALVAWMWLLQLEAREPAEAAAFENARDAGFGDADLGCDVLLGAAPTAQVFDGVGCGKRDLAWR